MATRLIEEYEKFESEGGEVVIIPIPEGAEAPEWVGIEKTSPKRKARKEAVINGFYGYLAGDGNEDLLQAVRDLAVSMLTRVTKNFGDAGACGNHDDLAQDICLKVLEKFDEFEGTGEDFVRFVKRVVHNKKVDAVRQRKRERKVEVPFFVEQTNEDGNVEEIENPALYETSYHQKMITIPASIQGEDLQICRWLLAGMKQAEIANEVGLTEKAVERRIAKIRDRESAALAIQRAERKKNDAPEKERQTYRLRMNQEYTERVNARLRSLQQD